MHIIIESLAKDYFSAFSNKDQESLFRMFDETVHLIDWEIDVQGRDAVMKNNQDLFNSVGSISVVPEIIAVHGLTAMAKILVNIDGATLKVIDVITFNELGKIIHIEAYKQ